MGQDQREGEQRGCHSCNVIIQKTKTEERKRNLHIAVPNPGAPWYLSHADLSHADTSSEGNTAEHKQQGFLEHIQNPSSELAGLANPERHSTGTATHAYARTFTSKVSEGQ